MGQTQSQWGNRDQTPRSSTLVVGILDCKKAFPPTFPDIYTFPLFHTQLALSGRSIFAQFQRKIGDKTHFWPVFETQLSPLPVERPLENDHSHSELTELEDGSEYTFTTFCALLAIVFPTPASTLKPPPRPCQTFRLTYSQIKHQARDDLTACNIPPRFGKDSIDDRDDTHTHPNFLAVSFILKTVARHPPKPVPILLRP